MKGAATPLRVLMTADTLGGVWTYALELGRALSERGVALTLATFGAPPTREQRARAWENPGLQLFSSSHRCEWMDDPWEDVERSAAWLRAIEADVRPDIVHLNGYAHAAAGFHAPVLVVAHSCVTSWWRAVHRNDPPPRYDRYRDEVARGLAAADRVVAPTRAMLCALAAAYGPLPPACVIPNGRSAAHFRPGTKEAYVLACGRLWDEAKNLAVLEHAARSIMWPIGVAGSLRHPEGGERTTEHVLCLGALGPREIARRMAHASILAHPARYEPFGLAPLEAALAGCALVLADIPSLREVWGDAARYVDPEDPEEVTAALRRLIASVDERHLLASRARARALRLTPEAMADRYLNVYRAMRGERAPTTVSRSPGQPAGALAGGTREATS